MRPSIATLVALTLLVAACDAEEVDPPPPAALFTAVVTDASDVPVEGLDLFVGHPFPVGSVRTSTGGGAMVIAPNPSVARASVYFWIEEAQHAAVRLYDLEGELVATLADQEFVAGVHALAIDFPEVADGEGGVFRVAVEGETATAEAYAVNSTGLDPEVLTFYLGTTDAEGRVVVDAPARFPSLYDDLPDIPLTDEQGNSLGTLAFEDDVELILVDPDTGESDAESFTLEDEGNEAELTWNP